MDKGNNAYLFLKQILYLYRIIGSILKKVKSDTDFMLYLSYRLVSKCS